MVLNRKGGCDGVFEMELGWNIEMEMGWDIGEGCWDGILERELGWNIGEGDRVE